MNYEQKCIDADKELAELLFKDHYIQVLPKKIVTNDKYVPRWTQDDAVSFRLAVEHEIEINFPADGCSQCLYFLKNNIGYHCAEVWFKDFPDKQSAVRFAIVHAVINKLKDKK